MDNKKLGLVMLGGAGVCWVVTMIGMIVGGSHRWSETSQQLGWMFFIAGFLVLYLKTGREIVRPKLANLAWLAGVIGMALFLVSLIFNLASGTYETWFEAFEAAGTIAMMVSVMSAIWAVGGWGGTSEEA